MRKIIFRIWSVCLLLLLVTSCSSDLDKSLKGEADKNQYTSLMGEAYKNQKGEIFFRIDNGSPISEKADGVNYKRYSYVSDVYYNNKEHSLSSIMDLDTLKMVESSGVYYKDKKFIYVLPQRAGCGPRNPYVIENKNIQFLGRDKNYLKTASEILYNGMIISLDYKSAKVIDVDGSNRKLKHEFMVDKDKIYSETTNLDLEMLCVRNIVTESKARLIKKYFRSQKASLKTCQKFEWYRANFTKDDKKRAKMLPDSPKSENTKSDKGSE